MTTLKALLDELEMRAGKATPGEREWGKYGLDAIVAFGDFKNARQQILGATYEYDSGAGIVCSEENSDFIIICSPDNILRLTRALRGMMDENARSQMALKALNKVLDFSWPYSDTKPWIPMGNPEIEALNAAFSLARAVLEQESKDE